MTIVSRNDGFSMLTGDGVVREAIPVVAKSIDGSGNSLSYNPNGQTTMANSAPVVIASDQASVPVNGNIASGVTDSGNPVKVSGKYNLTLPTFTDGQRGDLQVGNRGSLNVTLAGANSAATATIQAPSSDAIVGSNGALETTTFNLGYNGTTWDRMRLTGATGALLVENGPYVTSRKTADGQVKGSSGFLHSISIAGLTATPTAGLLTVYDALTETGTVLYSEWIFATVIGHTITLDIPFGTGLFIGFDATLTNVNVIASYR